jgi:arylsulfatase A-like enzyme
VTRPPHILLVVLDAARRDALAPYSPDAATPTLAGLARRGVAVADAYATAPWTLPSHVAMFTGALASEFGLDQAPGGDARGVAATIAPLTERLLATRLAAAGYDTHGYSSNLWISHHTGLDAGFGSFTYAPSARLELTLGASAGARRASLAWAREGLRSSGDDGAAQVGSQLRAAITTADPATPQFWFVNLVEAHSPYLPPRPFNDLGPRDRIGAALDCERLLNFESICLAAAGGLAPGTAALSRLAHLHRQSVAYMDAWLAGVLAALTGRGMLEDTLVIVTSDHGECFGEDGMLAHGFGLLQPLIHVPLLAAGPGAERFAAGSGAFSLRELPGLIAGAAGMDAGSFGAPGDGVAVSRAAAICPPDDPRMVDFAVKWSLSRAQVRRLASDRWSATDGQRTLALTDGGLDRALSGATDDADARLLASLEHASRGSAPPGSAPPDTAGAATGPAPADPDAEAVAALERQMKLLGYM